jgi:threonylcarbamoyladenosine tRNA methylthiotransferase MtaB
MTLQHKELKASFYTLGCKLNFAETSTIGKLLLERGISRAAEGETPDICVINTCSVTETADKKGRQLIRRLVSKYPNAAIVVTGCYAQLKPMEIAAMDGVDIVLGSNEKLKMADFIEEWLQRHKKHVAVTTRNEITEFRPSCERGDRTRYFLKVQDGCDYFCTYCTIPLARGRSRSGSIESIVAQAEEVAADGGKEIVITGINVGDFGKGRDENFFDLIKALDEVNGIERFRISSIEPNLITDEMIDWVATKSKRFMPHFHIPLQSGSDKVLRLMNRRYDTSLFASRLTHIRNVLPDAFIGVDIIAGAKGETPDEWSNTLQFVESLPLTRLHVFPYSERPNTAALALEMPVEQGEKHRRVHQLTELSDRKLRAFMEKAIGSVRKVLWEQPHNSDEMHGFTDNYLRVVAPFVPDMVNTVTEVKIVGFDNRDKESLRGEFVNS